VQRARVSPGGYGFVGANGGVMGKYSAGVYSTAPAAWIADGGGDLQAEIDGWPAPAEALVADGWATIETYTVKHRRDGARTGIVIGRLEADGRRFVARADDGDLLGLLSAAEQPVGERVWVRCVDAVNRASTAVAR
jgi:acetyl-CoA C-acetyltransferase